MQKEKKSWKFFLKSRVPVYFIFILMGIFVGAFIAMYFTKITPGKASSAIALSPAIENQTVRQISEKDYKLIKPLLLMETSVESKDLMPVKENIILFINKKKQEGIITSASVYLSKLNDGTWISVNKNELFSPGSIMKIPTLISILKDSERDPQILEKLLFFKSHFSSIPEQTITGEQLTPGSYYKIKDLLYFMIVFSDNDATALLNNYLNFNTMQKLFIDLQLPVPNNRQMDYQIDVADCSKFLRVLFSATYLNKQMSIFALDLLTKSAYREGIIKGLDPSIKVAHKFGERNNNGEQQLHEFAIVYLEDSPYLLGIMTKGSNHKILPEILSGISDMIYKSML